MSFENVGVLIESSYSDFSMTSGLCGLLNDDVTDDMIPKGFLTPVKDVINFTSSWRYFVSYSLFHVILNVHVILMFKYPIIFSPSDFTKRLTNSMLLHLNSLAMYCRGLAPWYALYILMYSIIRKQTSLGLDLQNHKENIVLNRVHVIMWARHGVLITHFVVSAVFGINTFFLIDTNLRYNGSL